MRVLKYRRNDFDTTEAHGLCMELEAVLGVALCVKDAANPNPVDGYFNTSSDGTVEVCLYEAADAAAIEATPQSVRFAACPRCGREQNDWTDPDVCEDCGEAINFAVGRVQQLRAHSGIYKAHPIRDGQADTRALGVLAAKGFSRHPDMGNTPVVRSLHHAIDAHLRAATKLERQADAMLRRAEREAGVGGR